MFVVKNPRPKRIAGAVAGLVAVTILAACDGNTAQKPPGAIGKTAATAIASATSSPSAAPSPTPAKVVSPPPKPRTSTKPPAPKPTATTHMHSGYVQPGAWCPDSEHGWYGRSSAGNLYRCSYYSSDGRWHWKRV